MATVVFWLSVVQTALAVQFYPHPGYSAPNFFSGTNARAFYRAEITFPEWHMSDAELYVGGQKVLEHHYSQSVNGPPQAWCVNIGDWSGVMFDSTAFASGTNIEIKHRVKVDGVWSEHTYTAVASNKTFLAGLDSLEDNQPESWKGTKASKEVLEVWLQVVRDITQWPVSTYFGNIDTATYHHYAGHGAPAGIVDGTHDFLDSYGRWMGAYIDFNNPDNESISVLHKRMATFNGTLPPFSPGPALSVTFLEACETGHELSDAWAYLFPGWNGYSKLHEDQAVLAFKPFLDIPSYRVIAQVLYAELANKMTLGQAAGTLIDFCEDNNLTIVHNTMTSGPRTATYLDLKIFGDPGATMKGVYTGEPHSSRPFSREISHITLD